MFPTLKEWLEDEQNEGREEGIKEERINTERERQNAEREHKRTETANQELRTLKGQFGLI